MQKLIQKSKEDLFSQHKSLSIQFSLDGFSFCVKDIPSQNIILLTEYAFDQRVDTPQLLLEKVQEIFESDKELQVDFESITAIHQNQLVTQVPNDYFDEAQLQSYLNFTIKTLASDYITFDNLASIEAKNVYIPYVNINNFLFQNFGEFEFKHHSTVLIEQLTKMHQQNTKETMYVNVSYYNMDVVVFVNGAFTLYNSFEFTSKEDFLYYILFVAEQLELDFTTFQLLFLGNIVNDYETYSIARQYIQNVDFIEPNHDFLEKSEHFFPHSNYILLS
ncbi:DUF3822 family protein [Tenacibaculum amylolyticum]|uniref:DUF3822 family protein n=1 Tax=Tenacibaculum amylolyticum TaxID=104269 RepID=UPI0038950572